MNKRQLLARFPRAAQGFLALNEPDAAATDCQDRSAGAPSELERDSRNALDEAGPDERRDPEKYLVRVTSVRLRLLDEDNLCEKFHVDCLRYAGILPSDAPGRCRIETTQRLCRAGEEEKTILEVFLVDEKAAKPAP
jgi:hypothetical protein